MKLAEGKRLSLAALTAVLALVRLGFWEGKVFYLNSTEAVAFFLGASLFATSWGLSAWRFGQRKAFSGGWWLFWGTGWGILWQVYGAMAMAFAPTLRPWYFSGKTIALHGAWLGCWVLPFLFQSRPLRWQRVLPRVVFGALALLATDTLVRSTQPKLNRWAMGVRFGVPAEGGTRFPLGQVEDSVAGKFEFPVQVAADPDHPDAIYVLERGGRLYRQQGPNRRQILDLGIPLKEIREQGAYQFVVDPLSKGKEPRFYLRYTAKTGSGWRNRLSRLTPNPSGTYPGEEVLIELPMSSDIHVGGGLVFGSDGMLYASFGDDFRHQALFQGRGFGLWGTVVRLDVSGLSDSSLPPSILQEGIKNGGYRIPADNPQFSLDTPREVYSLGLRNPYRMAMDPLRGSLWIVDVGVEHFESIHRLFPGGQFGWPFREGPIQWRREPKLGTSAAAVFAYPHSEHRRCIVGGVVYRGSRYPDLDGAFLFGDLNSLELMALVPGDRGARVVTRGSDPLDRLLGVSQVGEELVTWYASGNLYRLNSAPTQVAPLPSLSLFQRKCGSCHGGQAGGAAGVDFTTAEWQASRSDEEIGKTIRDGGAAVGKSPLMPSWKDTLSDEEISDIVKSIRAMGVAGN